MQGATYGLYRDGTDELIDRYTTDDSGAFSIPNDKLQGEKFYLKEIAAPAGYTVNPEKSL